MRKTWLAAAVMAGFLVACGGDGGDASNTPEKAVSAEGFWYGQTSEGVPVSLAILEDGSTWGLYADDSSFSGYVALGALVGTTRAEGNRLSGEGKQFDLIYGGVEKGNFSGTFTPRDSMNVELSSGETFSAEYDDDYERPASLAELEGSYNGSAATGLGGWQGAAIDISSSGQITMAADASGCSAAGQAAPRSSGKNVFDLSVTFSGSNCALGDGETVSGIAYYNTEDDVLLAMALNSSQTDGLVYVGESVNQQ